MRLPAPTIRNVKPSETLSIMKSSNLCWSGRSYNYGLKSYIIQISNYKVVIPVLVSDFLDLLSDSFDH